MINLLPEEEKQTVLKRRKLKLILIFEAGAFLFLVSLAFVFFSIRIYLAGEIEVQGNVIRQRENEVGIKAITDFQKQITGLNTKLKSVESFYQKQTDLSGIFQKISEILPVGIHLTSFSFIQDPLAPKINVTGFSQTREALMSFKRNLEDSPDFKKINFPPSTWVSAADVDFSLNLEVKK